ncbi:MAG: DNA adenine methylase, partial [Lentilitoribacter sp.]
MKPQVVSDELTSPKKPSPVPSITLEQTKLFPELRYMGSKKRLLPWIHEVLDGLEFESALDPFSGSTSVAYLLKSMGKRTVTSDFLNLSSTIGKALIQNNSVHLDGPAMKTLMSQPSNTHNFIEETFSGIFYTDTDLKFLDRISCNIRQLDNPNHQALAMSALMRSCAKKQPRGVFTISG